MACFHPLKTYVGPVKEPGKVNVVWRRNESWRGERLDLPCGQCIGCRLDRSADWAARCVLEASLFEKNCFVTLTFDQDHWPLNGSLDVVTWQKFMKRLRKEFGDGIRFFHAGEYGEVCKKCGRARQTPTSKVFCVCSLGFVPSLGRPHYHALLFNHDFDDKELLFTRNGNPIYRSKKLENLWPVGYSSVTDLTYESAGYVARYSLKKITGEKAKDHYGLRKPEYVTMSRRPGIAAKWFDKFKSDVFPSDELVLRGTRRGVPRFFDYLLDKVDPALLERLKAGRRERAKLRELDNDSFRLPVKEEFLKSRTELLKRGLEV